MHAEITNIGPIARLEVPTKPGAITVLRGRNGSGKTTALNAVNAVATHQASRLPLRDGTMAGEVKALGARIAIARNGANRRLGDVVVTSIDDDVSVADLVDPKIKDVIAADARRIKALVALVGAVVTEEQLQALVGQEDFDTIVRPESLECTDVVEMVERVKRDIEQAARLKESIAEQAAGRAAGLLQGVPAEPTTAHHSAEELQAVLEAAVEQRARIAAQISSAHEQRTRIADAQAALAKLSAEGGLTVEQARNAVADAEAQRQRCMEAIKQLEEQCRLASSELTMAQQRAKQAAAEFDVAQRRAAAIEAATVVVSRDFLYEPGQDEYAAAERLINDARYALEEAAVARDADRKRAEATKELDRAEAARNRAAALRKAAGAALGMLAGAVRGLHERVTVDEQMRLVVTHPARGQCYFAELSHGERWSLAIHLVVEAFRRRGQQGLLVIPQEAWEGLDAENRLAIRDQVRRSELVALTAEASQEPGAGLTIAILE
jgi:energy-coupling factor transporter ATP-binding protein EcfA2